MIQLGMNASAVGLVAKGLSENASKLRKVYKKKLRQAAKIVMKRQKQLLKAGPLKLKRRAVSDGKGGFKRTKTGRVKKRQSQLLRGHKVVIRKAKGGLGRGETFEAFIGTPPGGDAFYGKFHELGVSERQTRGGASRGALPARAWMGKALDVERSRVEKILGDSFRAAGL